MKIKDLQVKQRELDDFVIEKNDIRLSKSEILKNMILACHDEISEVEEAPNDIEEWIDVLHFVLSISNRLGITLDEPLKYSNVISLESSVKLLRADLLEMTRLSRCFKHWSIKNPTKQDFISLKRSLQLMVDNIYTQCTRKDLDMVTEYDKKYQINIQRQHEGY